LNALTVLCRKLFIWYTGTPPAFPRIPPFSILRHTDGGQSRFIAPPPPPGQILQCLLEGGTAIFEEDNVVTGTLAWIFCTCQQLFEVTECCPYYSLTTATWRRKEKGSITPRVCNFGIWWRWVLRLIFGEFYVRERNLGYLCSSDGPQRRSACAYNRTAVSRSCDL
jgi:hypothetical protein